MKFKLFAAAVAALFLGLAPASAAVSDLEGTWENRNPQAGGVSGLDIRYDRDWRINGWVVCRPRDCDLGAATGYSMLPLGRTNVQRDVTAISVGFNAGDAVRQLIIQSRGNNRIEVIMIQSWRDGRAASISTETLTRGSGGGGNVQAKCVEATDLRISLSGRDWVLAQGSRVIARFDSPDQAGYARYVLETLRVTRKCVIEDGNFEYWTTGNGAFPANGVRGEYCRDIRFGDIDVDRGRGGNGWDVKIASNVLYNTRDEASARTIARTLKDNQASTQCFVGDQGRGVTYFKR